MANQNRTIKFNIQALADTKGLDEFAKQLRELRGEAEPTDKVLGQAVKAVNAWADTQKKSADNTAIATAAIRALTGAMTAGGGEWKKATREAEQYTSALNEVTAAARANQAAMAAPARTTGKAGQQIRELQQYLSQLTIGSEKYLEVLQLITEREQFLGRRTGRAGVIAANQAFEAATLTRGYGASENLQAMPDTTAALRQRLSELAAEFPNVIRGSERYIQIATQMRVIESQLAKDLTGTTQALRQRSAATQAKIDAVRAYEQDARLAAFEASGNIVASRRQTAFGGVPQVVPGPDGTFIAPPYRTGRVSLDPNQYVRPIGPITAQEYSNRFTQYGQSIGPQPTALFQSVSGIGAAGSEARLQMLGRSYEQVARQIRETAAAAGRSTAALEAEKAAWDQLARSVDRGSREYKLANAESRQIDRQIGGRGRFSGLVEGAGAISAGAFFGGPEGLAGGIIGSFMGPGGALAGASVGAQVGIVRKAIGDTANYAAEVGKLRIALRGVAGSNQEYAQALRTVNEVSTALNVTQLESLQGFTRLTAAVIGAGGRVSDAEVVFKGISSAIKATGGSAEDVQSALLAMSQVFSKGKVSAEELQGQLGERLPGAVTLFAAATNRTLPQLAKDLKDGTVGLNDLMKFSEALSNRYAKNALMVARSVEDSGARQQVALQKLREEVGQTLMPIGAALQNEGSKWLDYATTAVGAINNIIKALGLLRKNAYGQTGIGQVVVNAGTQAAATGLGMPAAPQLLKFLQTTGLINGKSGTEKLLGAGVPTMYADEFGNVYDTVTGKPLMTGGRSSTVFGTPKNNNAADKAKSDREKAERQAREAAARQQRLDMQLYNDQVRLAEQLAENRIRLEDRVFEYKQELMRRERDMQARLDDLRLQNFINKFGPEGRAALAPMADFMRSRADARGQRADLVAQIEADRRALVSAQQMEANRKRFGAMYRVEDSMAGGAAPVATGGGSSGIIARTGNTGDSTGPHLDARWADRRPITAADVDRYLRINGRAPSSFGVTSSYGPRSLFGRSFHAGVDLGTPSGSAISLVNGARMLRDMGNTGAGGYAIEIMTAQGPMRLLHLQAGSAASMSGAPATTTLATGQTVRTTGAAAAALRGAGAAGDVEQAQAKLAQSEKLLKQYDAGQGALTSEQFKAAQLAMTQSLEDQGRALQDNADDWRERNRMELEGFKPEMIDFQLQKTKLLREQARATEAQTEWLNQQTNLTAEQRTGFLDSMEKQKGLVSDLIAGYEALAKAQSDPALALQRKIAQLDSSLRDFANAQTVAINLSGELENALSGGFSNSVNAIVTGSSTIQQSLGNMFLNIGNMFLDMVARMLATSATRAILGMFGPAVSGGGLPGVAGSGIAGGFGDSFLEGAAGRLLGFAKGGISSGPREGYAAMLHGTEAVVPLPNGRAIPVEMRGGSGTSVVVNVNMSTGQADVQSSEGDGRLLGEALSQAVQAELIRQKRPGGILYK